MAWKESIKNEVLVHCGRCCCICHKFCGGKIELHHIKPEAEGGQSDAENCIPLCFDCHADAGHYNSEHPKGTKYTANELREHRRVWFERVASTAQSPLSYQPEPIDTRIANEIHRCMIIQDGKWGNGYEFLKLHPAGSGYYQQEIEGLRVLRSRLSQPDMEFMDSDLESQRALFDSLLSNALSKLFKMMGPSASSPVFMTVGDTTAWTEEKRAEFERDKDAADEAMEAARIAYKDLFSLMRKRLGIDLRF